MPVKIESPKFIEAAGNKPKKIEEFIGLARTNNQVLSIARMTSPSGWFEPGQKPEFDEYTVVLKGILRVESEGSVHGYTYWRGCPCRKR